MAEAVARLSESLSGDQRPADANPASSRTTRSKLDILLGFGNRLVILLTLLLLVGVTGLVVTRAMYSGKVMPSVYVADVPVGGMSKDEALAAVQQRASSLVGETFVFDYNGRQWTTSLADLGVQPDVERSVDSAFGVGREQQARDRVGNTLSLATGTQVVPLAMKLDSNKVETWVTTVTGDIDRKPLDAQIEIANGKVQVTPDQDGIVVDKDRLMAVISESIRTMQPYRGPLPIKLSAPSIRVDDLDPAVAQITTALSSPIKIVYKEKQWTLQPADLGQFIVQTPNANGSGVTVSVDDSELGQWLYNLDRRPDQPCARQCRDQVERQARQGRCRLGQLEGRHITRRAAG